MNSQENQFHPTQTKLILKTNRQESKSRNTNEIIPPRILFRTPREKAKWRFGCSERWRAHAPSLAQYMHPPCSQAVNHAIKKHWHWICTSTSLWHWKDNARFPFMTGIDLAAPKNLWTELDTETRQHWFNQISNLSVLILDSYCVDVATPWPFCPDAAVASERTAVTGQYGHDARGGVGGRWRACEAAWPDAAPRRRAHASYSPIPLYTPSMNTLNQLLIPHKKIVI